MVSRQDAPLDLSPVLRTAPGSPDEVHGEGLLLPSEAERVQDGLRLQGPLSWEVTVRGTGGNDDLIAHGSVSGVALQECRRCLTDVPTEVRADFLYPLVRTSGDGPLRLREAPLPSDGDDLSALQEGEDRLVYGAPTVDFAFLLRQLFAIELPLTALCRDDCRGLATDGVNLNDYPDHVPEGSDRDGEHDSPFAALRDIDIDSRS